MLIGKNDDYAWIQTFIDYLKQIIDMIVKLFSGNKAEEAPTEAPAEDAE